MKPERSWMWFAVARVEPARPFHPAIESPERGDTGLHACPETIRGRVLRPKGDRSADGYAHYWWEVYDTTTGQVLVRSDAFGLPRAISACSRVVTLARANAEWGFWKPKRGAA